MGNQKNYTDPHKSTFKWHDQKITIFGIQCKYGYMYIIQSLPLIHIILNVETIWEEVKPSIHPMRHSVNDFIHVLLSFPFSPVPYT